ncbi:hypothetical protein [Dyadobacter sp. CY312]|uniref:hypothetical protein n=1 Tax=Dyadobacter sp. CY312 TaxID=2907303 RepID=UPI001F307CDD|nr:hypothetical protein [Dyadobacter sp. CY312]MCE7044046.1 hypothetical protein [Dyadobacter sp. CY312]
MKYQKITIIIVIFGQDYVILLGKNYTPMNDTNNGPAVKVMLLDDHALVAEGFRELLL